jgi:hypothetical protein
VLDGMLRLWWSRLCLTVCEGCDGASCAWWYAKVVMEPIVLDGMWRLWWGRLCLMVCEGCGGVSCAWWYAKFVLEPVVLDSMRTLWWSRLCLTVCEGCCVAGCAWQCAIWSVGNVREFHVSAFCHETWPSLWAGQNKIYGEIHRSIQNIQDWHCKNHKLHHEACRLPSPSK